MSPAQARKAQWEKIIVDLYLKGNSMEAIRGLAEEATGGHKFTASVIGKYIAKAVNGWKETKTQMVENHRAIELAKINKLEGTYWDAWLRSCDIVKSKSQTKKRGTGDDSKLSVAHVKEDQKPSSGDPQFLKGIQWCVEMRCKILGIEVPQVAVQVNNNNSGGSSSTTIVRRVVFKTRETTAAPQIIKEIAN